MLRARVVLLTLAGAAVAPLAHAEPVTDIGAQCSAQWTQMVRDHQTAGQTRAAFMRQCTGDQTGPQTTNGPEIPVAVLLGGVVMGFWAGNSNTEKPTSP